MKFIPLISLLYLCSISIAADDKPISIYTDYIDPYSYVDEQGQFTGELYHHVEQLINSAGSPYQFVLAPWSRAVVLFRRDTEGLMYPITRTRARENQFQWLVPIFSHYLTLYGRADRKPPEGTDITNGEYKFVCVGVTIGCEILRTHDIPESSITTISRIDVAQMLLMVQRGHVDFAYFPDSEYNPMVDKLKLKRDVFYPLKEYRFQMIDYLVAHPDNDSELVTKLKSSNASIPDYKIY